MPNKPIAKQLTGAASKEWSPRNGWMAWLHAEEQAEAAKMLPPPGPDVKSPQLVDLTVPDLGPVRVRFETWSYRAHKAHNWAWKAVWADKLDADGRVINWSES